jgi:hypothetical protein
LAVANRTRIDSGGSGLATAIQSGYELRACRESTALMYAFIHIPLTAGSTFRHTLRCTFSGRHCDIRAPIRKRKQHHWLTHRDLRRIRRVYPRLAGIAGHRVNCFNGLERAMESIRYVTFLRQPHQRLFSHFRRCHHRRIDRCTRQDFLSFCSDSRHRNVQTRWLCGAEDSDLAIQFLDQRIGFVGITEAFDESMVIFRRWLGHEDLELEYVARNVGPQRLALPIFEDPELFGAMEEAVRADMDVYRHAMETIMPRQKAGYGPMLSADISELQRRNKVVLEQAEPTWGRFKRNLVYKPLLHVNLV